MISDIITGFILVCGVIPLCFAVWTQINPWLYGFWINQLERHSFSNNAAAKFNGDRR